MLKLSTVMPYLKMIQKIYTLLEVCRYQYFFAENQQIWLHKEIYILIEFSYIIANFFNFFCGIKDCFKKKHGYKFDNVSEKGYSRLFENKGILK